MSKKRKKHTRSTPNTFFRRPYAVAALVVLSIILLFSFFAFFMVLEEQASFASKKESAQTIKKKDETQELRSFLEEEQKTESTESKDFEASQKLELLETADKNTSTKRTELLTLLKEQNATVSKLDTNESNKTQESVPTSPVVLKELPKKVEQKKPEKALEPEKPKLAIVLDDISFAYQVRAIKGLEIPLTMSFLPPNHRHPKSAKIARDEKMFMVHLPMEAMAFNAEEDITLRVTDSIERIQKVIKDIKKHYPRVRYINNHTGSKFTSNKQAMQRLIKVLKDENIQFIDSRTTRLSQAKVAMQEQGMRYMVRDIFIDHEIDVNYIKNQLKKAVRKAKKNGKAIAIGHPHKATLKALRESQALFKDIELVFIDKI